MAEAGRILNRTAKTIALWKKQSIETDTPYFKETAKYELYFEKEVIKQDKAKNLPSFKDGID